MTRCIHFVVIYVLKMCAQFVHPFIEKHEERVRKRKRKGWQRRGILFDTTQTKPEPFGQTKQEKLTITNKE